MRTDDLIRDRAARRARRMKRGGFVTADGAQINTRLKLVNLMLDDIEHAARNYQNYAYILKLLTSISAQLEQVEQYAMALELGQ
ncbi:MAG: hypothetical protein PUK40_05425 [Actinomycetaceae bacterium]|nr:hypothetical protein [Arcanobacterium sp.]MDD7505370.1 hypothetical protein [Actinomycetaceae bacterium]MDY6142745.1 hypothetical protein [Arcanobacterium sp.]